MMGAAVDLVSLDTARRMGGGQVCLERILRRLDRSVLRVTLACPPSSALMERLHGSGVEFLPLLPPSRAASDGPSDALAGGVARRALLPAASAVAVMRVARWLRTRQRAVVHANTFQGAVIAAAATVFVNRPLLFSDRIIKNHGALERWVCRRADLVLAVSNVVAAKWEDRFRDKTRVVIDGTDLEAFRRRGDRSLRERYGAKPSTLVVLAASRISREKRLDLLIEAVSRIDEEPLLLIAGEPFLPEDRDHLRDLEALAKKRGVRAEFLGFVDGLARALEAADVFVLPSPREPFGQVVIEAMAMSCPVVAARAGGPAEIIEHGTTGLLFEPESVDDLAAKISELARNATRRQTIGREARYAVEERYSIQRTVAEFEKIVLHAACGGMRDQDMRGSSGNETEARRERTPD